MAIVAKTDDSDYSPTWKWGDEEELAGAHVEFRRASTENGDKVVWELDSDEHGRVSVWLDPTKPASQSPGRARPPEGEAWRAPARGRRARPAQPRDQACLEADAGADGVAVPGRRVRARPARHGRRGVPALRRRSRAGRGRRARGGRRGRGRRRRRHPVLAMTDKTYYSERSRRNAEVTRKKARRKQREKERARLTRLGVDPAWLERTSSGD